MTERELLEFIESSSHVVPLEGLKPWDKALSTTLRGAHGWFSRARSPEGAMAGLWLYAGEWNRAHEVAQDLATREGSYWHAIVHRVEPDAWNSKYWFRQVGRHPIFEELAARAAEAGYGDGGNWDAERFVDFCVESGESGLAAAIQAVEWKLLFDYCRQGDRI
ncbi:MAG: hypothetical protein SFV18_11730 [Bryobacteraceae bacterium]|nr:hypothetical protein [Bryobacteraceae bacterium]